MRIGVVIVVYKTSQKEISRLRQEVIDLEFSDLQTIIIDNTSHNKGYAYGINCGIKKAIKGKCDLFIVLNPDISLSGLNGQSILEAGGHFDIWGLAMRQGKKIYYGGKIDKWRLSGGLITVKPAKRFFTVDFVSGSLMVIKKPVIDRIGLFDEQYFMYYEDVDYCYRAKKARFKIGIDSRLVYGHFEISKNNKSKNYWLSKSRWRFFGKFANWQQKIREIFRLPKTIVESL